MGGGEGRGGAERSGAEWSGVERSGADEADEAEWSGVERSQAELCSVSTLFPSQPTRTLSNLNLSICLSLWLELRRLPQILLVLVRRTINQHKTRHILHFYST